jgi:hypothetical protein
MVAEFQAMQRDAVLLHRDMRHACGEIAPGAVALLLFSAWRIASRAL